jgi:hypothetical protein
MLALVVSVACSELQGPTSPSPLSLPFRPPPQADLASGAPQPARLLVDWTCLSTGAGCPVRALIDDRDAAEAVPGIPFNLSFNVAATTVVLAWNMAPVGDPPASFIVEAGSVAGASDLAIFDTGNTLTSVTVTNVPSGTYYVRVRARNASGTSGPSNEVIVVVGAGPPPPCPLPPAPTGLTASVAGASFTLQWSAVAGALAYVIEAGSSSGVSDLAVLDTGTSATSYGGSASPGTYYTRVRARTACGTSGASNEAVFTLSAPPPGPGGGVTGRWLGLSPDGMVLTSDRCQPELDLLLDLVQSGSTLSGTATARVRKVAFANCPDEVGDVRSFPVSGTVTGNRVAFAWQRGGSDPVRLEFTGTVSGNRISGTVLVYDDPGNPNEMPNSGSWSVVRQ